MKHDDALDGWRGLAIGLVFVDHFLRLPWFWFGRMGVDLFFVLSGLLMSRILFEDRIPLAKFYWRRATRILPVFLLFVFAMYEVAQVVGLPFSTGELLATPTFTRTYLPAGDPIWGTPVPVEHLWSLNVEEQSYAFLSMVAALPLLRRRAGLVLFAVAAFTLYCIVWYWRHPDIRITNDYMLRTECAATGLLLAAGYRRFSSYWSHHVRAWMPGAALALAACCYLDASAAWLRALAAPFLLAFAVNHFANLRTLLEPKWLRKLGLCSFSLYIWQQPFFILSNHGHMTRPAACLFALTTGLISYHGFEAPVRAWLNKLRSKPELNVGAAA